MQITYDEQDDVLFLRFNEEPLFKDISYGWNVYVGMTYKGIGQITIIDAKESGIFPIQVQTKTGESVQLDESSLAGITR